MSTTTTASAATSTACGTSFQYELPVKDAACGVPSTDKYKGYLSKCAKPAGVTAYNNDCAIYALAVDQSVQELTDCLYDAGVEWKDVWCYGSTNATATATSYPTSSETSASTTDKKKSSTSTSSSETSTSTSGASETVPNAHVSLKAAVLLSTLFASAVFVGA
ncbi:unnamed protein product [Penicillium salamii]|uniref:Uncharacterized protein n=1 Tax=Penicillium salamii TaxID=1612424 RepID=A0A9W4JJV1_9EURO|nr:unnamed protein product [Penicillium salamii]